MRVRAAKAEGGHPGVAAVLLHGRGLRRYLAGEAVQVEVRVDEVQVDARRDLAVPDLQDGLDEPEEAGAALAVAEIRLGGRDHQRRLPRSGTHDFSEGAYLNGVAQRVPDPVAFEAVNLRGSEATLSQHGVDAPLLGGAVGRMEGGAPPVLVGLAAAEDGEGLALAIVLVDPEARSSDALAADVAVRRGVEGETPALVAQHTRLAALDEGAGVQHEVEAIDDGRLHLLEFPEPQVQLGDVCANQGRRASGVDGHAGPLEVHGVGEAVGDDGVGGRRGAVSARNVDEAGGAHALPVVPVEPHEVPDVLRLALQAPFVPAAIQER
mmetsp:Transcript_5655/g.18094  ORF Transcript_5655/g.18094 Transcript_5655/m.18094 type:complete len:323 (-) Transcript_5655:611-1579(-)